MTLSACAWYQIMQGFTVFGSRQQENLQHIEMSSNSMKSTSIISDILDILYRTVSNSCRQYTALGLGLCIAGMNSIRYNTIFSISNIQYIGFI
jgi:hypothetical protein